MQMPEIKQQRFPTWNSTEFIVNSPIHAIRRIWKKGTEPTDEDVLDQIRWHAIENRPDSVVRTREPKTIIREDGSSLDPGGTDQTPQPRDESEPPALI